jgi:hypothetical protein
VARPQDFAIFAFAIFADGGALSQALALVRRPAPRPLRLELVEGLGGGMPHRLAAAAPAADAADMAADGGAEVPFRLCEGGKRLG